MTIDTLTEDIMIKARIKGLHTCVVINYENTKTVSHSVTLLMHWTTQLLSVCSILAALAVSINKQGNYKNGFHFRSHSQ